MARNMPRVWFPAMALVWLVAGVSFPAAARTLPDFTALVESSAPAVVNISTTQKRRTGQRSRLPKGLEIPDLPEDHPFHDFFKRFFGEEDIQEFDSESLGSGFIISPDGYVISNYHVIRDADEIIVRLSDRREFKAELVGGDERSDVALLKVEASKLPVVKLGTGYNLKVGEWVLAIGSPFGFDHSATAGIVSAKGRSLPRENYVPFIQTDVAINPGNSGGPLFNLDGEVVGVNSQIFSRTGGFMGLSFAIPIDVAMEVADQLRDSGKVSRGWLGVLIQDVTPELAESFAMSKPQGALIARVLPDSPAEKAGLAVGDIVLSFDSKPVLRSSDLPPIVGRTKVGRRVPVKILRDGDAQELFVRTAELPEEPQKMLASGGGKPGQARLETMGMVVADPTPEEKEKHGLQDYGVMVVRVTEGGPAAEKGVKSGDVVLRLAEQDVESAAAMRDLVDNLPSGKPVAILLQREGNPIYIALKIGK